MLETTFMLGRGPPPPCAPTPRVHIMQDASMRVLGVRHASATTPSPRTTVHTMAAPRAQDRLLSQCAVPLVNVGGFLGGSGAGSLSTYSLRQTVRLFRSGAPRYHHPTRLGINNSEDVMMLQRTAANREPQVVRGGGGCSLPGDARTDLYWFQVTHALP